MISFLVRRYGTVAAPARRTPARRARSEMGIYPYRLAATRALAVEAGQAIWGYPRFLAEIAIGAERGWARCSLAHDGREVMRIAVREGGSFKRTDPNLPNFSVRDGVLRKPPWEQQGSARARLGGARIELGSHPIAGELRPLALPKRALMSATMRGLSATYGSPVDISAAPAEHGSSPATA